MRKFAHQNVRSLTSLLALLEPTIKKSIVWCKERSHYIVRELELEALLGRKIDEVVWRSAAVLGRVAINSKSKPNQIGCNKRFCFLIETADPDLSFPLSAHPVY